MSAVSWAVALLPVWALLAGAPADAPPFEIDVADVSNAPDACPTQDQLGEALEARMPGVVARGAREANPNLLRVGLAISPDGIARVTMTDAAGALRLERDLDLPKSGAGGARERGGGCAALAETVALIVERYMRHIGYHEPPPLTLVEPPRPPPPPPAPPPPPLPPLGGPGRLGLGLATRLPYGGASWRFEAAVTGAIRVGRLDLSAAVGADLPSDEPVPLSTGQGKLHLQTFPARVAVGWTVPVGRRLALVPAVGGGFDFVLAETQRIDVTRRSTALEPTLEAGLRAVVALTQRVWIDLQAFQGIDVRPEQFQVMLPNTKENVFLTPRAYTRLGVDFGVFLGKN